MSDPYGSYSPSGDDEECPPDGGESYYPEEPGESYIPEEPGESYIPEEPGESEIPEESGESPDIYLPPESEQPPPEECPVDDEPPVYTPNQLTVRFLDEKNQPASELGVLWRVAGSSEPPPEDGGEDWFDWIWGDDEEEAPPNPFATAITDELGFLTPLFEASVPVDMPETVKFAEGVPYEVYYVRHPSRALILEAADELNGDPDARTLTKHWGDPIVITTDPACDDDGNDEQLTVALPSTPESYHPAGHARYGGWVLYKDMPHATLDSVVLGVQRAQADFGRLRFIVGIQEDPYISIDGPAKQAHFNAKLMNATLQLQRCSLESNAFAVEDRAAAHGSTEGKRGEALIAASKAYLAGELVSVAPEPPGDDGRAMAADGVLDEVTARTIEAWDNGGLRWPERILIPALQHTGSSHVVYMREDVAPCFEAWRTLLEILGFEQGARSGHAFRDAATLMKGHDFGASKTSLHKTGCAIDMHNRGHLPDEGWPVTYVQRERVTGTTRGGAAYVRHQWLVYGPTKIPTDYLDLDERIRGPLMDCADYGDEIVRAAANVILAKLDDHTLLEPAENPRDTFYEEWIVPFHYDAYHEDGGEPGTATSAADDRGDPSYTRFLNVTKIARLCGLREIPSFKDYVVPKDSGAVGRALFTADFRRKSGATGARLVQYFGEHLVTAKAEIEAEADVNIPLCKVDGGEVSFRALRGEFITAWGQMLVTFNPPAKRGDPDPYKAERRYTVTYGPALEIRPTWSDAGKAALGVLAGAIGAHGAERVHVTVGKEPAVVMTCAEVQSWLPALENFQPPAKESTGGSSAKPKPPSKVTFLPIVADSGDTPLALRPDAVIKYPGPGEAQGQEWWHFQLEVEGGYPTFGAMLGAIGWSFEGLTYGPHASLHFRTGLGYAAETLDETAG
jgi:hypothetical protein